MQQEAGVRDDSALWRRDEAGGEQPLEVDVGLLGLHHRQRVLHAAALRRDRPLRLLLHGHLGARPRVHLPGERREVEPRRRHQVDEGHARHQVDDRSGQLLGLAHTGLVGLDALLESRAGLVVAVDHRNEVVEELRLGVLGDLGPRGVEGRERRHRPDEQVGVGGQLVGRLPHPPAVEDVGVRVELGVAHPGRLHRGGQPVGIGVGHDDRRLTRELPHLDQARAGRVGLPVADDGIAAAQLPDPHGGFRDLLRPGVGRVRLVVVVAHVDLDAPREQRLDGRGELGGRRRVDEDHAARSLRNGSQDGLAIGGGEELAEQDGGRGDDGLEHLNSPLAAGLVTDRVGCFKHQ